jgi:2-dehydro-3-deoxyglucarate aldolase/4-hydroxy-2-oxoheptanedioate aldolase
MGNYWVDDYNYETWKTDFEDHFIVIPQIESKLGSDRAEALAAHPIVTALGLGPYDLYADIGCFWDPSNPEFIRAHDQVKTAADSVGKKVWAGCDCPDLRDRGYTFLWIVNVTSTLTQSLTEKVKSIRSDNDGSASES